MHTTRWDDVVSLRNLSLRVDVLFSVVGTGIRMNGHGRAARRASPRQRQRHARAHAPPSPLRSPAVSQPVRGHCVCVSRGATSGRCSASGKRGGAPPIQEHLAWTQLPVQISLAAHAPELDQVQPLVEQTRVRQVHSQALARRTHVAAPPCPAAPQHLRGCMPSRAAGKEEKMQHARQPRRHAHQARQQRHRPVSSCQDKRTAFAVLVTVVTAGACTHCCRCRRHASAKRLFSDFSCDG